MRHQSPRSLEIAIVCYDVNLDLLERVVMSIEHAVKVAGNAGLLSAPELYLIDNGPDRAASDRLRKFASRWREKPDQNLQNITMLGSGQNLGYGGGNNIAINNASADYFLILNPDVILDSEAFVTGLSYLREQPDTGVISPAVFDETGQLEYLCKRFPSVLDLMLRGFAPEIVRDFFDSRMARYEMRDVIGEHTVRTVQIISGAFMLFRTSVLRQTGGFDERYFLYFEDFDLSLRAGELCGITYLPAIRVTHFGGAAARKGWRHIWFFTRSAFQFFNQHGWKWI